MIESRLIRKLRQQRQEEDELVDFVVLLLQALEIPEARAAIAAAITPRPAATSPPGRGQHQRASRKE